MDKRLIDNIKVEWYVQNYLFIKKIKNIILKNINLNC